MTDEYASGDVHRADHDARVHDVERFLRDRETEALAMVALWGRSRKTYAADELSHWRAALARVRRELERLAAGRSGG